MRWWPFNKKEPTPEPTPEPDEVDDPLTYCPVCETQHISISQYTLEPSTDYYDVILYCPNCETHLYNHIPGWTLILLARTLAEQKRQIIRDIVTLKNLDDNSLTPRHFHP